MAVSRLVKGGWTCFLAVAFALCSTGVAAAVPTITTTATTATTAPHRSSTRAASVASAAGEAAVFTPVTARRLLDASSASGTGATAARGTTRLKVTGTAGVPSTGVSTVVLTVAASRPAVNGYLSVYADGTTRPLASNVNFAAGITVADQVYAPVGADGMVSIYNGSSGALQLVVDLGGYFTTQSVGAPGAFVTTTPTRILDTSAAGGGGAVGARDTRSVTVLGRGPVPGSGVAAVVLTLAAVAPGSSGYRSVYRDGDVRPATSNVNFGRGSSTANLVIAPLGTDGKVAVYNGSSGATRLVADVAGYLLSGTPSVPGAFVATTPTRILTLLPVAREAEARLGTNISPAVPPDGVSAAVLNVNVSAATARGYATVFPAGAARLATSNLNFTPAATTSGMVAVPTGDDPDGGPEAAGGPWLYNGSSGSVRVTVDAFGYYLAPPGVGAISGTATDSATSHGVGGVNVIAYTEDEDNPDQDAKLNSTTTTAADGSYLLPNLWSGQQYWVCFDTRLTTGTAAFTGYSAQCYNRVPWPSPGNFVDDPGADLLISVTTGVTTTGIDASLNPIAEGGLAGTVTTTGGAPIANVSVAITSPDGVFVVDASSDSSGRYAVSTLPAGSYNVCFHATAAPAAQDPYSYVDQCLPSPVTVTVGDVTRADAELVAAGGISGHIRTASGATDDWSSVALYDHTGVQVGYDNPARDGGYTFSDLAPGNYSLCFNAGDPDESPPYGYVSQCYRGVAWESLYGPPAGTTTVTVRAGATTTGVDATLATAGVLSGKVTNADGAGLQNVGVTVFDPMNRVVAGSATNDGTFTFLGLTPAVNYTVCFDGSTTEDPSVSYANQCWKGVPWNGEGSPPPSGTTPVTVTAGAIHSGLDVILTRS